MSLPALVVGNGWSALAACGLLSENEQKVIWVQGTSARIKSPLPSFADGRSAQGWTQTIGRILGESDSLEMEPGLSLREFKNKAFQVAPWTKAPDVEEAKETKLEKLWAPEQGICHQAEASLTHTAAEYENQMLERIRDRENVVIIEGVPPLKIDFAENVTVTLADGTTHEVERVIYADKWSTIRKVEGISNEIVCLSDSKAKPVKVNQITRRFGPHGCLQVTFDHEPPVQVGISEGFYTALQRESGEKFDRHVFGCFSGDGKTSTWTLCINPDEVEDNHQITKRLRRIKQALNRMFTGETWVAEGNKQFMDAVKSDSVVFEDSFWFAQGKLPRGPWITPEHWVKGKEGEVPQMAFLTDGFGTGVAMEQVMDLLGDECRLIESQAEEVVETETSVEAEPGSPA